MWKGGGIHVNLNLYDFLLFTGASQVLGSESFQNDDQTSSISITCLGKWPEIAFGVIKQTYVPTVFQALM